MRRRFDYSIKRLEARVRDLPPPPDEEHLEQIRAENPGCEVWQYGDGQIMIAPVIEKKTVYQGGSPASQAEGESIPSGNDPGGRADLKGRPNKVPPPTTPMTKLPEKQDITTD